VSLFFRPARHLRRAQSGRPCPGCGLTVHANDLVLYAAPTTTYYLHEACAEVLAEMAAAPAPAEEDAETGAALDGAVLDAEALIVPDSEETQ